MNLKEIAVRGGLWSAFQNGSAKLINFCVFVVLARLLAPQDFGLVAIVGVALAVVQLFIEQSFEEAIVQRKALESAHLDTTFWFCGAAGVALSLLTVAASPLISFTFAEPKLTLLLMASAPCVLLASLSKVPLGIMRREFSFRTLAIRQVVAATVGGVVGVWLAVRGYGAWSLIWRQLAESATAFVVLWIGSKWRPRVQFSASHLKDILGFGSHLIFINGLGFLSLRADSLIVGYFLGSTALGFYTVAQRLFQLLLELVHGTISQVAMSVFAQLQGEPQRLKMAFLTGIRWTSLPSFLVFMLLIVLANPLVPLVFGAQWTEVAPVASVLAVGGLLFSVSYYNGSVMKAMGKPGWVLGLVALNAVANMIGFFIGVGFGIVGVAIAFVVRGYLVYPANLALLRRLINLDLKEYALCLAPALVSGAVAAAVAYALLWIGADSNQWVQLGVAASGGCAAYLIVLLKFWPEALRSAWEPIRGIIGKL